WRPISPILPSPRSSQRSCNTWPDNLRPVDLTPGPSPSKGEGRVKVGFCSPFSLAGRRAGDEGAPTPYTLYPAPYARGWVNHHARTRRTYQPDAGNPTPPSAAGPGELSGRYPRLRQRLPAGHSRAGHGLG